MRKKASKRKVIKLGSLSEEAQANLELDKVIKLLTTYEVSTEHTFEEYRLRTGIEKTLELAEVLKGGNDRWTGLDRLFRIREKIDTMITIYYDIMGLRD